MAGGGLGVGIHWVNGNRGELMTERRSGMGDGNGTGEDRWRQRGVSTGRGRG